MSIKLDTTKLMGLRILDAAEVAALKAPSGSLNAKVGLKPIGAKIGTKVGGKPIDVLQGVSA